MAITNVTADVKQGLNGNLFCSKEFLEDRNNELIVLIALNLFVSVTASLGNALILAALRKQSSLHPPSKLLFRTLATTDLAVGIIAEPLYVASFISVLNGQLNICRFAFVSFNITSLIFCGVSLLTLTAICVDRLLALLLGLRYRQVVTFQRIFVIVIVFWFVSIILSTVYLLNPQIPLWWVYSISLLCFVSSVVFYAKIFFTLRQNRVHAPGQQNHNVLPNRARYKKTVNSTLWVKLALVLCYLPNAIMQIVILQRGLSPSLNIAGLFTGTLILLNSSLNPILYCWKIREVRQAAKEIVRGLFCSSS